MLPMNKDYKKNLAGKLAKGFIEHPLTFVIGLVIIVMGYITLQISPREANPQIVVAGGAVIVPYPGVRAAKIQKTIVEPLMRRLREVEGVEDIYGIARDNVAILNVKFFLGEERDKADFRLYNAVIRNLDSLPEGVVPIVKTLDIDTDVAIASIALYPKDTSVPMTQIYQKATELQTKINRIENVGLTRLIGDKKPQYNIEVDLQRLSGYHLSLGQIVKAVKSLSVKTPDINGETGDDRLLLFGMEKGIESTGDIENIIVANYGGSVVYLKDVATVSRAEAVEDKKSAAIFGHERTDGKVVPQTTITVSKKRGANAVTINREIFKLMDSLEDELGKENIGYIITKDDGYTADHSVNELVDHILISILIIFILLIYALGYKEAAIVTLTVPMIISLTLFSGYVLGQSINKVSLFAILLSLGLLVDSAIIVIENIHRHFHDHDAKRKTIRQIAIEATNEIGNPTNLATVAIAMTFLTMFMVEGTVGQYIRPIAIYAPIAMFASLFVAYVFTPYLANKFMTKDD